MITGQLHKADLQHLANDVVQAVPPLDYEAILEKAKNTLKQYLAESDDLVSVDLDLLPESDSVIKILEVLAYRELITRQRMNEALKACFLATAKKDDLHRLANLVAPNRIHEHVTDEQCREQVLAEYQRIHTAGSSRAYKTLAHEAAGDNKVLREVHVTSVRKGEVDVSLLYQPRVETAEQEEAWKKVNTKLQDDSVRPIGQKVTVTPARVVPYQVKATLGFRDRLGSAQAIMAARKAVLQFIEDKYRFGQNIYHNAVLSALHQPGVDYIILQPLKEHRALSDVASGSNQAPWCHPNDVDIQIHTAVPVEKIKAIHIENFSRKRNIVSCELVITPPQHEIRLTHYTLYWGNELGEKLAGVASVQTLPVGGDRRIRLVHELMPTNAKTFVVYTVNENGEMGTMSGAAGKPVESSEAPAGFSHTIPETNNRNDLEGANL